MGLGVGAVVLITAVAVTLVLVLGGGGPEDSVRTLIGGYTGEDCEAADDVTHEDFGFEVSLCEMIVERHDGPIDEESFEVTSLEEIDENDAESMSFDEDSDDDQAIVRVVHVNREGDEDDSDRLCWEGITEFLVQDIDGEWLIVDDRVVNTDLEIVDC